MGFLKRLLGLEQNNILLSAAIIADEDHRYYVSFEKHHPDLQIVEFVRIVLHYYAKMLFVPDKSMAEFSILLLSSMQGVIDSGISKDSNIFHAADIDDVAAIVKKSPTNMPRKFIASLCAASQVQRHIKTTIPRNAYMQHSVFSVFALLDAVLKKLDAEMIGLLDKSLTGMNEIYAAGHDFRKLENLTAVPNAAYANAAMSQLSIDY